MHISKDIAQHARGHAYMYVRCVRELSPVTTRGLLTQIPWGTGPVEQVGFCFPFDSFCQLASLPTRIQCSLAWPRLTALFMAALYLTPPPCSRLQSLHFTGDKGEAQRD